MDRSSILLHAGMEYDLDPMKSEAFFGAHFMGSKSFSVEFLCKKQRMRSGKDLLNAIKSREFDDYLRCCIIYARYSVVSTYEVVISKWCTDSPQYVAGLLCT